MAAAVCSCSQIPGSFHKRENTQCCASCTCIAGCCSQSCSYTWSLGADFREQGLEIHFCWYSRTPLIRPPSESHWCGRIRGMVAREGFVYEQKPLSVTRNVVVWEGWSLVRVVVRQGFYCSSKLLLPGARPGSKTNFLVAKLDVHFLRNENILILCIVFPQQSCRGHLRFCSWTHYIHYTKMHAWSCTKLTIQEFMAVANVCYHMSILVANEKTW